MVETLVEQLPPLGPEVPLAQLEIEATNSQVQQKSTKTSAGNQKSTNSVLRPPLPRPLESDTSTGRNGLSSATEFSFTCSLATISPQEAIRQRLSLISTAAAKATRSKFNHQASTTIPFPQFVLYQSATQFFFPNHATLIWKLEAPFVMMEAFRQNYNGIHLLWNATPNSYVYFMRSLKQLDVHFVLLDGWVADACQLFDDTSWATNMMLMCTCHQWVLLWWYTEQGVLFFLAAKSGFIEDADEAALLQNFIICVEMLVAAVGHFYAFPYKEYAGANIGGSRGLTASLGHALKLNDFYHDTVHQFAPTYHEYVLYNHSDGEEGTRKYRSRTFVPIGPEMDSVRRNKHMFGNKLDDIQLSSLSSSTSSSPTNSGSIPDATNSDAMKSSLLVDMSNSVSASYDLTLIDLDVSSYPEEVPAADNAGGR
ncbi:Organic solute transporter Ost-alpha [Spatholobus suberectus]|nr:Organic solute transporter Ost-alpha [Spatholobus suberectus]